MAQENEYIGEGWVLKVPLVTTKEIKQEAKSAIKEKINHNKDLTQEQVNFKNMKPLYNKEQILSNIR